MTTKADKNKQAQVRDIAERHLLVDEEVEVIYELESKDDDEPNSPIRLLEVTPGTTECGVVPVAVGSDPEHSIFRPIIVVDITPNEFKKLEDGELRLPEGWGLGKPFRRKAAR